MTISKETVLSVSDELVSAAEDTGYDLDILILSLIQAVITLADDDDDLLDSAANFLADGGF